MLYNKLDYITDKDGFISMVIYNTHPQDGIFISPKYFPHPDGIWRSRIDGTKYQRFEYYWNLKQKSATRKQKRVYDVDTNPLHDYSTDITAGFDKHLRYDPCYGVSMYLLPEDSIITYHDARARYRQVVMDKPQEFKQFMPILDNIINSFKLEDVGITGSYLYGIYQDFSDLNVVFYGSRPIKNFYNLLRENNALEQEKIIPLELTLPEWEGWINQKYIQEHLTQTEIDFEDRFIGSIHDPSDPNIRVGFWLADHQDVLDYGTFKKRSKGKILIKADLEGWEEGMASGHFILTNVEILGLDAINMEGIIHEKNLNLQIVGEFNRMFLFDEEVIIFGLLQEVEIIEKGGGEGVTIQYELLVGSREIGGWVAPVSFL